jgi:hypothetical protein
VSQNTEKQTLAVKVVYQYKIGAELNSGENNVNNIKIPGKNRNNPKNNIFCP